MLRQLILGTVSAILKLSFRFPEVRHGGIFDHGDLVSEFLSKAVGCFADEKPCWDFLGVACREVAPQTPAG